MRKKYLIGVIAVLVLILAVWLVPMALAAANGSPAPSGPSTAAPAPSQGPGSATECPFLRAHQCPYLDPDGGTSSSNYQTMYY
jgi:hypothetical protein